MFVPCVSLPSRNLRTIFHRFDTRTNIGEIFLRVLNKGVVSPSAGKINQVCEKEQFDVRSNISDKTKSESKKREGFQAWRNLAQSSRTNFSSATASGFYGSHNKFPFLSPPSLPFVALFFPHSQKLSDCLHLTTHLFYLLFLPPRVSLPRNL